MLTICVPLKGVKSKNDLLLRLMELLVYPNPSAYRDQLIRFSALNQTAYSGVKLSFSVLHWCILHI
jgi:acetyl-CoA carboxylase/biotin carboxylase 1